MAPAFVAAPVATPAPPSPLPNPAPAVEPLVKLFPEEPQAAAKPASAMNNAPTMRFFDIESDLRRVFVESQWPQTGWDYEAAVNEIGVVRSPQTAHTNIERDGLRRSSAAWQRTPSDALPRCPDSAPQPRPWGSEGAAPKGLVVTQLTHTPTLPGGNQSSMMQVPPDGQGSAAVLSQKSRQTAILHVAPLEH